MFLRVDMKRYSSHSFGDLRLCEGFCCRQIKKKFESSKLSGQFREVYVVKERCDQFLRFLLKLQKSKDKGVSEQRVPKWRNVRQRGFTYFTCVRIVNQRAFLFRMCRGSRPVRAPVAHRKDIPPQAA